LAGVGASRSSQAFDARRRGPCFGSSHPVPACRRTNNQFSRNTPSPQPHPAIPRDRATPIPWLGAPSRWRWFSTGEPPSNCVLPCSSSQLSPPDRRRAWSRRFGAQPERPDRVWLPLRYQQSEAELSSASKPKDSGRHPSTHDAARVTIIIVEQMKTPGPDQRGAWADRQNGVETKRCREHCVRQRLLHWGRGEWW